MKYVCKYVKNGIGDPSSKYAFDKDGKQFEADIKKHLDDAEILYTDFVEWMKSKGVTPEKFRGLFRRYYTDFIEGVK
jgi:hypothetical protein